jgi:hypothetical protein
MESFRARSSSRKKSGFRKSTFDQPCQIKGYLDKKSTGVIKRWQKRYFEIAGHYLKCSQDEGSIGDESSIKSAIDLNKLTICQREGNVITLKLGSETCELQAPNEEETQLWHQVFETFIAPSKPDLNRSLSNSGADFYKSRTLSGARKSSSPAVASTKVEPKDQDFGLDTPEQRKAKRAEERARLKAKTRASASDRIQKVDETIHKNKLSEALGTELQAATAGASREEQVASFAAAFTEALLTACCNLVQSKRLGVRPAAFPEILFGGIPPPPRQEEEPPPPPTQLPRMTGLALAETTDLATRLFADEEDHLHEKGDFWQRRTSHVEIKKNHHRMSLSARRASRYDPNVGLLGGVDEVKMVDKKSLVASAIHADALRSVASMVAADALSTALKSVVEMTAKNAAAKK